jgi:hypothetical protein
MGSSQPAEHEIVGLHAPTRVLLDPNRRSPGVTSTVQGDSCLSASACADASVIVRCSSGMGLASKASHRS